MRDGRADFVLRVAGSRADLSIEADTLHRSISAGRAYRLSARGLYLGRRRGAAVRIMAGHFASDRNCDGRADFVLRVAGSRADLSIEADTLHRSVSAGRSHRLHRTVDRLNTYRRVGAPGQ